MTRYLIRRTLTAIVVLIGIAFAIFTLLHVIAPSPGRAALGVRATPQAVHNYNQAHGYLKPFLVQFLDYLNQLLHGDLGFSFVLNQSVTAILGERAPLSAFLSGTSVALAILIAIPLGIYQAVKRNSIGDTVATVVAFTLYSTPVFLFGVLLIQIFVFNLGWVDANVPQSQTLSGALADFQDIILPIVALTATNVATYSRFQRSSALDVLAQDYIRVARAKGLLDGVELASLAAEHRDRADPGRPRCRRARGNGGRRPPSLAGQHPGRAGR